MQQAFTEHIYDVVIVGAGPAGCACALALKDSGLRVVLIDKASFPRDKVCGDAIPGRAIKTLRAIDPAFAQAFAQYAQKYDTQHTTLYYNRRQLTFSWVQPAYTCRRVDFDNFLLELVQQHTNTTIKTGTACTELVRNAAGVTITAGGERYTAQMVVGADGAHSVAGKHLAPRPLDRAHHAGSVRAYYANISGLQADTTEIFFERRFLPSYLWVFPLPGNVANVGFGMLSSEIVKRRINLKTAFHEFIDNMPELKARFANAEPVSTLDGFGLPLGSKPGVLSGDRFLLAGDAASLIDPISGDGIGNAMLSGRHAGEQVKRCFAENDFSATAMKPYDAAVMNALGKELRWRHRAQQVLGGMPLLLDAVFAAGNNRLVKKMIQRAL